MINILSLQDKDDESFHEDNEIMIKTDASKLDIVARRYVRETGSKLEKEERLFQPSVKQLYGENDINCLMNMLR